MQKGGLLEPFEKCEFSEQCITNCHGREITRSNKYSCGKRRGLLMADGYKVIYERTTKESKINRKDGE